MAPTRGGPFLPGDYGVSTFRDKTVYLHVLKWTPDGIQLPALPARVIRARLLSGAKVDFTQNDQGLKINVAAADKASPDTVVALDLDRSASEIPPTSSK